MADFKERFEVSKHTVYDDIEYFRSTLRAPLKYSRSRRGYCSAMGTWYCQPMMATEGELLAFFPERRAGPPLSGHCIRSAAAQRHRETGSEPAAARRIDLSNLTQHYTFQPGATVSANPVLLTALSKAIVERWRVAITYFLAPATANVTSE
ncbi:MAG: hypothetical protein RMJ54_13860 [Roseiflexaceae bacterium]|nr:hypothetical protein [Roseiflexaceae bacterium]